MNNQVLKVTARKLNAGKVELTAHLADGTAEVIAKKVSDKPVVQMYSAGINGNSDGLGAFFTVGKTIRHKELHVQEFKIEVAA